MDWDIWMNDTRPSRWEQKRLVLSPAEQSADQMRPCIAGDLIAYEDSRYGWSDIYLYNMTSGTELGNLSPVDDNYSQESPQISGDRVIWLDAVGARPGTRLIRMYQCSVNKSLPDQPFRNLIRIRFTDIASHSGYGLLEAIVYTVKITAGNMPQDVNATLHMSASASWIGKITDGRNLTSVPRILDNRTMGEMLWTEFLYHDPVKNLDYFEAFSPHGLSTFGLIQTSRRGNPPQLLVLTITEYIRASGENVADSSEPPKKPAVAAAPPAPSPSPMPQITEDPGRSAKVYTNANGTVTQATLLRSTDGLATISIGEGIVAKDAQGKPLTVITLKALPSDSLPAVPSGSAFSFPGMAYDLGPDGSAFAPHSAFSLTPPGVRWGQDYSVRSFDGRSGTWQDLPTSFNTTTGTITAQVSHLCTFALFSRVAPSAATSQGISETAIPETPQLPSAPPAGAIGIFADMMEWIIVTISSNPVLSIGIGILIIAAYLFGQGKSGSP